MRRLTRVVRGLTEALGYVASALVLLLVVHVTADATLRTVFNAPIAGTTEIISLFYMIGIAFLPLGLVERKDAHISVEVLTEMMPARIVHVLLILATILGVVVMAMLCWRTWLEALSQMRRNSVVVIAGRDPVITWPSYFVLPFGFGVAALVAFYKLICLLTGRPFFDVDEPPPAGLENMTKDEPNV
ncbi:MULTISPECIES: TRAP transporter small permease [unclassified Haematobacter]|uniref:TRAP transporter small permease n=1 Tax=unclassified Haematobacter TaxID=2640585 RepID=UPI0025C5C09B|nr:MULTISPECIES: TRAP transporter small permease [unclassified Haematobacter]